MTIDGLLLLSPHIPLVKISVELPAVSPITKPFTPEAGGRFNVTSFRAINMIHGLSFEKGGKAFVHPAVAGLIIGQDSIKPLVSNFMNDGSAQFFRFRDHIINDHQIAIFDST